MKPLMSKLTGPVLGNAELYSHPPCGSSYTSEQQQFSKTDSTDTSQRYAPIAKSGTPGKLNLHLLMITTKIVFLHSAYLLLAFSRHWHGECSILMCSTDQRTENTGLSQPSPKRSELRLK